MKTFSLRVILTVWLMEQRFCRNDKETEEITELIKYLTKGMIPKNRAEFVEMVISSMESSQKQLPELIEQIQSELKKLHSWHDHTTGARRTNALQLWVKRQNLLFGRDTVELEPLTWFERRTLRKRMAKAKDVFMVEFHIIVG